MVSVTDLRIRVTMFTYLQLTIITALKKRNDKRAEGKKTEFARVVMEQYYWNAIWLVAYQKDKP